MKSDRLYLEKFHVFAKRKNVSKKASASLQVSLLVVALFAFAYLIGQMEVVSGEGEGSSKETASQVISTLPMVSSVTGFDLNPVEAGKLAGSLIYKTNLGPTSFDVTKFASEGGLQIHNIGGDGSKIFLTNKNNEIFQIVKGSDGSEYLLQRWGDINNLGDIPNLNQDQINNIFVKPKVGELTEIEQVPESENLLSSLFGVGQGTWIDSALTGVMWAAVAYGVGMLVGSLLGWDEQNTQALSTALAGGTFTWQFLTTATGPNGFLGVGALGTAGPFFIGLGVAAIIFIAMYKDVETVIVKFDCMTWQAPSGGNNCEECNSDTLPCSEYRCKSLGQNCEIVNAGTVEEKCVNINPRDVNPPIIKPNILDLTAGHEYKNVKDSPPGPGFSIVRTGASDGCLKAFTPLEFGIKTDEPSQCRIDFNSTTDFDDMIAYVGGSNLYAYNHTEIFSLPGAKAFENSSFKLENGKNLVFYIRCKDKNGNTNEAEYAVKFCMDPTPDTTAPKIKATSILNGGCVAENATSAKVEFYTDEPAECKWSHTDQTYEQMPNIMSCPLNIYQLNAEKLFTCVGDMSGIARDGTDFFVRCKDQPGQVENNRNKNMESYKFNLRGSTALKMKNIMPNSSIFGGVSPAPVELYVETLFGCDNGKAVCFYSTTDNKADYIRFFDTEKEDGVHTQRQDLASGDYKYYIKCVDSGGNVASSTTEFSVNIDTSAPVVARIYEESEMLKVVTVRDSECAYTFNDCDFTFEEGTSMPYANSTIHVAEWNKDKTYYIKCRDEFLNEQADCSAIVKPSRKLF